MVLYLDDIVYDEIAIHALFFEEQAASAPPAQDPHELEHLLRQNCRDLIAASYTSFQTAVLENPFGTVYNVQKQQAIAALKAALHAKAAAASSAEERQIYLNYARVAHLQFAQKAKGLDTAVASYHQDVPEPQYVRSLPSEQHRTSDDFPYFLAMAGVGRGGRKKRKKDGGRDESALGSNLAPVPDDSSPSSPTARAAVPLESGFTELVEFQDHQCSNPYSGGSGEGSVGDRIEIADITQPQLTPPVRPVASAVPYIEMPPADPSIDFVVLPLVPLPASVDDDTSDPPTAPGKSRSVLRGNQGSKVLQSLPGSPDKGYQNIQALAAQQQRAPHSRFLEKAVYSTLVAATVATAVVLGYTAPSSYVSTPSSGGQSSTPTVVVSSAPVEPISSTQEYQEYIPASEVHSQNTISYEQTTPPLYDAQNPAPWYQIKTAKLRNDGQTLDLRLGPHLSMEGRTVRVNYDNNGDGKADRTKYVDSQELLTITVPGTIIDVGVGFRNQEQLGFTYHSSVRFDDKNAV